MKKQINFKTFFYPNNWREIIGMVSHIFMQLFFAALIAQINVLLFVWYSGDNEQFLALINKATLFFTTIQFIPSLVASGALIVGSRLVGQGRKEELSKIVRTGIAVNLIICSIVMIIVQLIAPQILELLSIDDAILTEPVHGVLYNQLDFASTYFRINIIQLLLMSVAQVYISGLQALKKQKHIAIGAILSNVVDVAVVSLILFVVKTNPILASLGMPMAALFQLVYMGIISHKNINYHQFSFKDSFNFDYGKQITKVGLPITLEIALWQICNFTMNSAISNVIGNPETLDSLYNIHYSIVTINNFATVFLQATATVTSILVAKQIGMNDKEGALRAGADGWKIAVYGQIILSALVFILIYPLLIFVFNRDAELVRQYGMIMYLIVFIKCIFDTVNMTLLRALWSVGDLWTPLMISIFTMVIGMIGLPWLINLTVQDNIGLAVILIYISVALDPIIRSIIYVERWFKRRWFKYAK